MIMRCWPVLALLLTTPMASGDTNIPVLEPIIVTATRTTQTADETLAAVTIITREDIERRQARSVPDLLRGVPGLSLINNGGPGKVTTMFLRGTEANHVLVLIDGIEVGSATTGLTPFQDIPVEQIERIEIVRGPRSSLYGSEAIGGVIQIFTRRGGAPLTPSLSLGAGSYETYEASAGIAGGGDRSWYNLRLSGFDTEGFNACRGQPGVGGCFVSEPEDDGYRNLSLNLRGGYRFSPGTELDLHVLHVDSENEFDGSFVNESESLLQVIGGKLRFSPTDSWTMTLSGGQSRDESDNFLNGEFQTRFDTERFTASWQNDVFLDENHLLTLGLDYQDDQVDSTSAFTVTSRDNWGVFAQYQGAFEAHDLQFSLRRDDNQQFGDTTTGSAAWGYGFANGVRLIASYGTAFKAPDFNDLFFPGFGNPNLDPEESRSFELSIRGETGWGTWSINAFHTQVDDLIAFDAATSAPANVDTARIRGLELIGSAWLAGWQLAGNLTLLDPENRSDGPNGGNILPRRAEQSFHLDIDRTFGRYQLGATLLAEGQRFDDLANARKLDGYATVDLRAEYSPAPAWTLAARLANLFDEDYETAAFFNQPGRNIFVTLRYQPDVR